MNNTSETNIKIIFLLSKEYREMGGKERKKRKRLRLEGEFIYRIKRQLPNSKNIFFLFLFFSVFLCVGLYR